MGIFGHHKHETEPVEFMGVSLDADALETPAGSMPLGDITRAEFKREVVADGHGPEETSTAAVAGGAVLGGVVFGAAGAVAGAVLGSTVKEDGPEEFKTQSVQLIFETADLDFHLDVPHDKQYAAVDFVDAVKRAIKHHRD